MSDDTGDDESLVDQSHVLKLLRVVLTPSSPSASATGGNGNRREVDDDDDDDDGRMSIEEEGEPAEEEEEESGPLKPRIKASCTLWDLAMSEYHASFLVQNAAVQVIGTVLSELWRSPLPIGTPESQRNRFTEVLVGLLGNICVHRVLAERFVLHDQQAQSVIWNLYLHTEDRAILSETSRVLSAIAVIDAEQSGSSPWRLALQHSDTMSKALLTLRNSLDANLLYRASMLIFYLSYYYPDPVLVRLVADEDVDSVLTMIAEVLKDQRDLLEHKLPGEPASALEYVLQLVELATSSTNLLEAIKEHTGIGAAWPRLLKEVSDVLSDEFAAVDARETAIIIISNALKKSDERLVHEVIGNPRPGLQQAIEVLSQEVHNVDKYLVASAAMVYIERVLSWEAFTSSAAAAVAACLEENLQMLVSAAEDIVRGADDVAVQKDDSTSASADSSNHVQEARAERLELMARVVVSVHKRRTPVSAAVLQPRRSDAAICREFIQRFKLK